jgi:hypothetical protein
MSYFLPTRPFFQGHTLPEQPDKKEIINLSDWELVGQGGSIDIANIAAYEDQIPEGAQFQIGLQLRVPAEASIADTIKSQMTQRGVPDADVTYSGNTMQVYGRKGFPWLAVIAAIILAILVLVIILVNWSIFKRVVPAGLQGSVLVILLIAGAIMLAGSGIEKVKRSLT